MQEIWRTVLAQIGLTVSIAIGLLYFGNTEAISGLIGGMAAAAGNGILGFAVFRRYKNSQPGNLLGKYYFAEFVKLILTILIFLVAMLSLNAVSIVALLGGYLVVHLASGFLMIYFGRTRN